MRVLLQEEHNHVMNSLCKTTLFLVVISMAIFSSCAKRIYEISYPILIDGKYDSEFPYRSCSKQLEEIGESVMIVNCIAYYSGFVFSDTSRITEDDINEDIREAAIEVINFNNSASGTATVIYSEGKYLALLTCAHILDFPDTIISYRDKDDPYLQSISFREGQMNYVTNLPEGGEIEIIKMDESTDVAILGKKLSRQPEEVIPVFSYPLGRAGELEWGNFIYLFSYPMGNKMVTTGIVSSPGKDRNRSFVIDAVFNRGCSGGIVLAIRDGVPNFELVGMARSAPAEFGYILKPSKDFDESEYDPNVPYEGKAYPEYKATIKYGVTYVISIETIIKFLRENHKYFLKKGYDFSSLF